VEFITALKITRIYKKRNINIKSKEASEYLKQSVFTFTATYLFVAIKYQPLDETKPLSS
jgi:hypothetical protein